MMLFFYSPWDETKVGLMAVWLVDLSVVYLVVDLVDA